MQNKPSDGHIKPELVRFETESHPVDESIVPSNIPGSQQEKDELLKTLLMLTFAQEREITVLKTQLQESRNNRGF